MTYAQRMQAYARRARELARADNTQALARAAELIRRADRVIVMNDGQVAMDGRPRDVFAQVDELHALGLAAPDTVELLYRLQKAGLDVSLDSLTVDECADTICRALGAAEGK